MPHCLVEDTIGRETMFRLQIVTFCSFNLGLTGVPVRHVNLDEFRIDGYCLSSVGEEDVSPVCLGDSVDQDGGVASK